MVWKPLPDEGPEFEAFMRSWRRTKASRFLVDESLDRRATGLLREGWGRKRRVLLTHDRDFLDDRRFSR
jgi:hypothetical protein